MDVIELAIKDPGRSEIAYQELCVGRHSAGLDGRDICAHHATVRACLGKIYCPGTSATADV